MSFIYNYFFPPEVKFGYEKEYNKTLEELVDTYTTKQLAFEQLKYNQINSRISRPSRILDLNKFKRVVTVEHRHNELPPKINIKIKNFNNNFKNTTKKNQRIYQPSAWKK